MTKEELFRAVGEVQEDQITEAETVKKQSRPWRRYGTLAACLAVVLAGAFALERMEGARKWAELEEGFDTLARPESALDSGGGAEDEVGWHEKIVEFHPAEVPEDNAGLDGADYWSGRDTRPASNYSVNVEIGELDGGARTEDDIIIDGEKHRTETDSASCLAWLSPEEIFAQDTAVFRGIVRDLRYYVVEAGGFETQYTVAAVEITDPIRGDLTAGEIRTVLYIGGPDMSTSLSGPLTALEAGSDAIFMPIAASPETGRRDGDSWFCYADLGEFYLSEGMRYVFLDTGEGLSFERGLYEEIAEAKTLDEVAAYIRRMTGAVRIQPVQPEQSQPAAVPVAPQADPAESGRAQPSYGVEGPNGGRELPDSTVLGPEDLLTGG
ncbi:MAG: hypothetical protein HFG13_03550 [Oscillibacter sp.]|nr:hypothetical protein [Oscillibacter sp.]